MILIPIARLPKLHITPLATILIEASKVIVEADDEFENRIRLIFRPYQAVKVTTSDCFILKDTMHIIPQTIVKVDNSEWLNDFKKKLIIIDETANFLNNAIHYLLPLQDDFLEIISWEVTSTYL